MAVSGLGVAYAAGGFVLLYSGYANVGIKSTLTSFLKGQVPTPVPNPLTVGVSDANSTSSSSASGTGTATGSAISDDAMKYEGHAYAYGGAPGPNGTSPWDCSSMDSFVLGHDLGYQIPGGSWASVTDNGSQHGPATTSYLVWSGATTVGNSASSAQAGDLLVWQTHMGICTGGGNMISALNESLGTQVTTIADGAPTGELLFVRRVK